MFKKVIGLVFAVILVLSTFVGCGKTAPTPAPTTAPTAAPAKAKKDLVIGGIYKDLSQVWFIDESKAAKEMAIKMGAKDMVMADARMNPDTYLAALDNMIAQKVDGLLICVPDQKLSKVTIDKCKAAGIPVIANDDGLIDENGKHIAPALELDAFKVGTQQGDWLVDYVKTNSKIKDPATTGYLVLTMETVSSCKPRSEGQIDAWGKKMTDFPKANIIKADYKGSSEEAFTVTAAALTANPKIKTWFVTTPNDEGAQGATRALEQSGLDKNAVVVGLGGYLAKDEFKKPFSCFVASAYIQATVDGETTAKALMEYILNKKEIFAEYKKSGEEFGLYPLGAKMVTKDNYKEVMGKDAQ